VASSTTEWDFYNSWQSSGDRDLLLPALATWTREKLNPGKR
jgi:hypothetical protein